MKISLEEMEEIVREEVNRLTESTLTTSEAIRKVIDQYDMSPDMINAGPCDLFAYDVRDLIRDKTGREVKVVGDPGRHVVPYEEVPVENPDLDVPSEEPVLTHVWIYDPKTEKYYDAQCPEGVKDWHDLPFFGPGNSC